MTLMWACISASDWTCNSQVVVLGITHTRCMSKFQLGENMWLSGDGRLMLRHPRSVTPILGSMGIGHLV